MVRKIARRILRNFGYELRGRVSSLLEVGTGFHNELTGRENVYLNGTVLGMSKAEVDRKFEEIVAFSVAAHLEPEILLVDEVLSVGDVAFQKKCLGKMESVAGEGQSETRGKEWE